MTSIVMKTETTIDPVLTFLSDIEISSNYLYMDLDIYLVESQDCHDSQECERSGSD